MITIIITPARTMREPPTIVKIIVPMPPVLGVLTG